MEKQDNIHDNENSYDFGARILDPRLGRWFSRDPMATSYPSMSPYNTFADNPILFIDPDGTHLAFYDSETGVHLKTIKTNNPRTALFTVNTSQENYASNDEWSLYMLAKPLVYHIGSGQQDKKVSGKKLRDRHPLKGVGWKAGNQVYLEDIIDMTDEFNNVVDNYRNFFKSEGGKYSNHNGTLLHGLFHKGSRFYDLVFTDMPFDLKSQNRNNLKKIPSNARVFIGEYPINNNRLMHYDDYGNLAFGAWGKEFGYDLEALLDGATLAQLMSTFEKDYTRDQYFIDLGFKQKTPFKEIKIEAKSFWRPVESPDKYDDF